MRGFYRIYLDGELVEEVENLITTAGKQSILRFLAGQIPEYAGAIAVGTATNAAAVGDTYMGFEVARAKIDVKSVKDYALNDIVFRASLPTELACSVRELGLLTSINHAGMGGSKNTVLSRMDSTEGYTSNGVGTLTDDTTNARLGADAVRVNAIPISGTNVLTLATDLPMANYTATDRIHLMMGTFDTHTNTVKVEFLDSSGNSIYYTFTPATHTAGNGVFQSQILSAPFSSFVSYASGMVNATTIKVTTVAKGTGTPSVIFDGLNVTDSNTFDQNSVLVSRAIPTAVAKAANVEMDVEYTLRFTL